MSAQTAHAGTNGTPLLLSRQGRAATRATPSNGPATAHTMHARTVVDALVLKIVHHSGQVHSQQPHVVRLVQGLAAQRVWGGSWSG